MSLISSQILILISAVYMMMVCVHSIPTIGGLPYEDLSSMMIQLQVNDQCGGLGGFCHSTGIGNCKDHIWPNAICPYGSRCMKDSPWFWKCKHAYWKSSDL
jgi:hypothetical protein